MAMSQTEKQGYTGNLESKTKADLLDLLCRQEKLLANRKFIGKLPDKGEKILCYANRLKKLIDDKEEVDKTSLLLDRMTIDNSGGLDNEDDNESSDKILMKELVKRPHDPITLPVQGDHCNNVNQYALAKASEVEKKSHVNSKEHFYPHRSLKSESIQDVPDYLLIKPKQKVLPGVDRGPHSQPASGAPKDSKERVSMDVCDETTAHHQGGVIRSHGGRLSGSADRGHHLEDSAVTPLPLQHKPAQLIPLEESINLLQSQQQLQEELRAKNAAQRLAERQGGVRMTVFNPEGSRLRYREPVQHLSEEDSDDEPELDYPD